VGEGHGARPRPDEALERGEVEGAVRAHGRGAEDGAALVARGSPGEEARMVLELRHQDLVAGPEERRGQAAGDAVQGARRATGEDDLAGIAGVKQARGGGGGRLEDAVRVGGEWVRSPPRARSGEGRGRGYGLELAPPMADADERCRNR
jgi:hypothetical protein